MPRFYYIGAGAQAQILCPMTCVYSPQVLTILFSSPGIILHCLLCAPQDVLEVHPSHKQITCGSVIAILTTFFSLFAIRFYFYVYLAHIWLLDSASKAGLPSQLV